MLLIVLILLHSWVDLVQFQQSELVVPFCQLSPLFPFSFLRKGGELRQLVIATIRHLILKERYMKKIV